METKKNKFVLKRHYFINTILKPYLWFRFVRDYKFKYQKHKELKGTGPYLILGNHTISEDPILLSFLFPMWHNYYVVSDHIFNSNLLSKLLAFAVNPIRKSRYLSDLRVIRNMKNVTKEGGTIGIFVEDSVTYSGITTKIDPTIVKLVRFLAVPIILYNTEGLYLSNPRWSTTRKHGKTTGYINKIVSVEEYQDLSDDDLYKLIADGLQVSCYENVKLGEQKYVGDKLAEGLQRLVFVDLKTGKPFETYTQDNYLLSFDSDMQYRYDVYGYLYDENHARYTLRDLELKTYEFYLKYLSTIEDEQIFDELVMVEKIHNQKKTGLGEQILRLFINHLEISSEAEELVLNYEDIANLVVQGKRKIVIYINDDTYLLTLDESSSPLKYLVAYQYYRFCQKHSNKEALLALDEFGLQD